MRVNARIQRRQKRERAWLPGSLRLVLNVINDKAIERQDQTSYRRLNQTFHFAIYEKADSPHLLEMIKSLWGRVGPIFNSLFDDPQYDEHANMHHRQIVQALKNQDSLAVRAKLAEDITAAARTLLPRLDAVNAQE